MIRLLIALCLVFLVALPAFAAPGDPRFLQGTVEWPATLTGEPIVIVRGDDGRVYSADVAAARRHGTEMVRAGGRVALLVLEGARPHDVTAIVIGAGDSLTLARSLSQGGAAAVPVPAPVAASAPPAPAPALPTAPAVAATPPATLPAPPAPSAPPTPAPATATTAAKPPAPAPPAATVATPPATVPPSAPPAAAHTVVVTPPPPPTGPIPAAAAPAPATPSVAPPVPAPNGPGKATGPSGDRKQWARVDGKVQSVEGALLVLKSDNGTIVMVDISQLNPNVSQALRHGRLVSVYGYPLEQKFEAAGYIELDPSHPEPPRLKQGR